ncbi:BTAD domain-containing putative transcriptional regulator [Lentzea sp. NPDC006480]|uniref:AfsR/SARP family transcriptional regulator n=1 Tax=Lentzea sp. NPDC006480 TaxID=3157176 RepID=UPI0033A7AC29
MAGAAARELRIGLLGEVEARVGDLQIVLGPPRQRAVLAILAMRANQAVSRGELIDGVWGDAVPPTVEGSVHTYIHGLRRALSVAGRDLLTRTGTGYHLVLVPGELDLAVVESQVRHARAVAASGEHSVAADLFGECLAMWRGVPLSGVPGPFADTERVRLTNLRYELVEERADLMLAAGRHRDVLAGLDDAIKAEPYRERMRAQLMLALYRSGRRAEALAEFDAVRRLLADELGLEPGSALTDLQLRMLRSDPELDPATEPWSGSRASIPSQLPHEVPDFVGRVGEMTQLSQWRSATESGNPALLISAIDGAGGIGKTSLAVRFARHVVDSYPDGQLYLDLRGFDPNRPPMTAFDALGQLLGALGSTSFPSEPDALVSTYRSLLSGRRFLILLDNAASTEQVRDLLPGESNNLVLITSRNRLSGLVARDGARRLTLGLLSSAEAVELLRRVVGPERIDAEPEEAATLARLCGYLPLALRIAAEKVSSMPNSSLGELVANLIDEQSRLDVFGVDDDEMSSVRGVFSWSYRSLDPALARTFRLLGLVRGPDIGVAAAAALVDRPAHDVEDLLKTLSEQHLLETNADRFSFHDLVNVYAGELVAREETSQERTNAIHRLMDWYLQSMRLTELCIDPGYPLFALNTKGMRRELPNADARESADAWFKIEAPNVLALTQYLADLGERHAAWQLAWFLYDHYYSTGLLTEWIAVLNIGLSSSRYSGDPNAEMRSLMALGIAYSRLGQNEIAADHLERSLILARKINDTEFLLVTLANLGSTLREMKQHDRGILCAQEALNLAINGTGTNYHKAGALDSLVDLYVDSGQLEHALRYGEIGLEVARASKVGVVEANILVNLGHTYRDLGAVAEAVREYEAALDLCKTLGDRYHEALALLGIAELHRRKARYDEAREQAQLALGIFLFIGLDGDEAGIARDFLASLGPDAVSNAKLPASEL